MEPAGTRMPLVRCGVMVLSHEMPGEERARFAKNRPNLGSLS
jgi:hypothetical protein